MGCCFSTAKWKRTEVVDHKWDYVDLNEFTDDSVWASLGYMSVFIVTFRSVLTYMADLSTAVLITQFNTWSFVSPTDLAKDNKIVSLVGLSANTFTQIVPFITLVYLGSIAVSFILLFFDSRKSRRIIKSRDISFSFTDVIAYRYYCLRSFPHWCFFREIRARRSFSAQLAFFIFFTLKDWKRLLFAETPRHLVNFIFLSYHVLSVGATDNGRWTLDTFLTNQFGGSDIRTTLTSQMSVLVMAFVFTMYAMNVVTTIIAGITYVPLLCHIRGNLKEYVCHMTDKRIAELMLNKAEKRINKQQQELALYGATKENVLNGGPEAKLPVFASPDPVPYSPVQNYNDLSLHPQHTGYSQVASVRQHATGSGGSIAHGHRPHYPPSGYSGGNVSPSMGQWQQQQPSPLGNVPNQPANLNYSQPPNPIYPQSTGSNYPTYTTAASMYATSVSGPIYPQSTGSSGNISTRGFTQRNGNRY